MIIMKALITVLFLCVAAGLLVAGCTTPTMPTTPTPTTTTTPLPTATTQVHVTDTELVGNWTLGEMGLAGGQASLNIFPKPITITFYSQGILVGNGGCNNYQGSYTLNGTSGSFGKTINMGPIITTQMYCVDTSKIETTYFQILSSVTEYGIDNKTILSMRDPSGSTLVYQRI
jgi:heat shock protein HslJ